MSDIHAVEIRAELRQVKSMADFTYNAILNVPEDCLPQVQALMAWLGDEVGVIVANTDEQPDSRQGTGRGKRGSKD